MKRAFIFIILGIALGAGGLWLATRPSAGPAKPDADEAAAKPAGDDENKTSIAHDTNGNVTVGMSDKLRDTIGIVATHPVAAQLPSEIKAYGRVVDPAPLTGLMSDLAAAQANYTVSSNEFARLKTLEAQGNTSAKALQAADAAALKDQLAAQAAKDHLAAFWGAALPDRASSPEFIRSLGSLDTVLVRVDLAAGDTLSSQPTGARVVRLSGESVDADFLGTGSGVDPQVQGRGFIFVISKNEQHLLSGEAVTAYLKLPGASLQGVIIPRDAVVRTEGKGWIYIASDDGKSFTRIEIPLDHAVENGWFIEGGVSAGQKVVTAGAQVLLSEELKTSMSPD